MSSHDRDHERTVSPVAVQDQGRDQDRDRAQSVEKAEKVALSWVNEALRIAQQCKEGAIEGKGPSLAEQVCVRLSNALGAEDARELGQGAAKVALGIEGGREQLVVAGVKMAANLVEIEAAADEGQLPELVAQRAIEQEFNHIVLPVIADYERKALRFMKADHRENAR